MSIEDLARYIEGSPASEAVDPSPLRERYRGVLLGVAAGNALGIPVEGRSRARIRERFPRGLTEVHPSQRERLWDDDLAQTVLLAEALLDSEALHLDDLGARLLRWYDENGHGIGNLTLRVIEKLEAGTPASEAARQVWEEDRDPRGKPAGNGAIMRCSPVALRWCRDGMRLIEETRTSALVTHYDPRCVWSAVAFNVALARRLTGAPIDPRGLARCLDSAGAPSSVGRAVRATASCSLDDLALDGQDMGYTLKAMQVGLWALRQRPGFEEALVEVVSAGGDTDTNGAVAGAALGAMVGENGIPRRWLDNVPQVHELVRLADQLYEASPKP